MDEENGYSVANKNTIKGFKDLKEYQQKAKGISFSAFLLSIIIYISIFYIFNLSPSSLIGTTKFWFFISNTLILIIAVDYGAFSSSRHGEDHVYDEYMLHNSTRVLPVQIIANTEKSEKSIQESKVVLDIKMSSTDTTSSVLSVQDLKDSEITIDVSLESKALHENEVEVMMITNGEENHSKYIQETPQVETLLEINDEEKDKKNSTSCCSETDQKQETSSCNLDETIEFSSMTNEELNTRIEEFIEKFKRQIRLQKVRRNLK